MNDHKEPTPAHRPSHRSQTSSTIESMQFETLEQIAERLGWSPTQLANARASEAEARPSNLTERDHARAEVLSRALKRTRRDLDAAS